MALPDKGNIDAGWHPISPGEVGDLFRDWDRFWCIAGGCALDLFAGRTTRDHEDTDVLILRRDADALHSLLPGWELYAADPPGQLRRWLPTEPLPERVHDIWCREVGNREWRFQFMVMDHDETHWIFRRNRTRISAIDTLTVDSRGFQIIAPEVQLLFKGTSTIRRPKDEADFRMALPHLDDAKRIWLRDTLALHDADHPWLPDLKEY